MQAGQLLALHDEDFLREAYRLLLGRAPDEVGRERFLQRLRSGTLTKIEILGRLRFSAEGRARGRRVRGLALSFLLRSAYRIPVLGHVLRLPVAVLRLPVIVRNLETLDAHVHFRIRQLEHRLAEHAGALRAELDRVEDEWTSPQGRVATLQSELGALASRLDDAEGELRAFEARFDETDPSGLQSELAELRWSVESRDETIRQRSEEQSRRLLELEETSASRSALERAEQTLRDSQETLLERVARAEQRLQEQRRALVEDGRRLTLFLREARKRLPKPLEPDQLEALSAEEAHVRDGLYADFEEQFRGPREEVRRKLSVYLPYVRRAVRDCGGAPVLDLGCGRGEWLELLRTADIASVGVDRNRVLLDACRERDLRVEEGDALEHLRAEQHGSLGGVTAFHLIEHLPYEALIDLLQEALRALCSGGVVIFETPNPENLVVGANSFYADPTHRNPIHPATLKFLVEEQGFVETEILHVNEAPAGEWSQPVAASDPLARRLNAIVGFLRSNFLVAPDFAVVARKA